MAKKAQLAMETVMIYGIILVVVMVAIGALLYFGVLDLGKYLPDKCDFAPADFQCSDYQAKVSGTPANSIQLVVTNMVGKGINNIAVAEVGGESACGATPALTLNDAAKTPIVVATTSVVATTLANGEQMRITFTCTLAKGDKTDLTYKITYNIVGKEFKRESTGTVKVKALA